MRYVDGFVLAVPKKNLNKYKKMAQKAGKVWKKYGALEYFECWGDDLKNTWTPLQFAHTVKAKPNETVVFAFIVFKSKAHRNSVNAKVMKDPYMQPPTKDEEKDMPFDTNRMTYGGFKAIVDL
jgi:uncharacterized protein YbaA (DUF1428 family)